MKFLCDDNKDKLSTPTLSMLWLTHVTLLASHREGVEVLMGDLQVPTEEFSYGRSKIFIRNPRTVKNSNKSASHPWNMSSSQFWHLLCIDIVFECLKVESNELSSLFSHSAMFAKQGGLQQLACSQRYENTWFHLASPSNMGNEHLYLGLFSCWSL